jgi:hypothetical protein
LCPVLEMKIQPLMLRCRRIERGDVTNVFQSQQCLSLDGSADTAFSNASLLPRSNTSILLSKIVHTCLCDLFRSL